MQQQQCLFPRIALFHAKRISLDGHKGLVKFLRELARFGGVLRPSTIVDHPAHGAGVTIAAARHAKAKNHSCDKRPLARRRCSPTSRFPQPASGFSLPHSPTAPPRPAPRRWRAGVMPARCRRSGPRARWCAPTLATMTEAAMAAAFCTGLDRDVSAGSAGTTPAAAARFARARTARPSSFDSSASCRAGRPPAAPPVRPLGSRRRRFVHGAGLPIELRQGGDRRERLHDLAARCSAAPR